MGDLGMTRAQESAVRELLYKEQQQRKASEFARLREAHNKIGYRVVMRDKDGMGASVEMMIPPTLYHECGTFYGYNCWDDADFCDFAMTRWPEIRVHSKSQNPSIIVPNVVGTKLEEKPKRFSKSYATGVKP